MIRRLGEPVVRTRGRAGDEADGARSSCWARPSARRWSGRGRWRGRGTPTPTTCWARRRGPSRTRCAMRRPMRGRSRRSGRGRRATWRRARGSRSSCRRCIRATSGRTAREVMDVLVPRARELARAAARAGIGFNIDAEEAERLDLSLDVIEALLRDPELAGWDGFGVVVQAYGRRCGAVIDWLDGAGGGGSTGGSWCGWSRAPTGTPRSSRRRSAGCRTFRCSRASPRPT